VLWLLPWVIATVIITVGIFVYGWNDVVRTHWQRVWAISGVCVTESLRRKVLWLTPLAMIGIVVVCQFQVAASPQDVIQQTTKFCLFASAMLVTVTAIILACTNLPREIETRIIFTIVTKPTTRLEIVLGKVLGYARVSALIIIIMGVFTLAYLQIRARPMIADLKSQMQTLPANSPIRASDEYYVNSGLLGTRSLVWGSDVEVYAAPPNGDENWSLGGVGQYILIPFALSQDNKKNLETLVDSKIPVYINFNLDVKFHKPDERQRREAREAKLEEGSNTKDNDFNVPVPETQPSAPKPLIPEVQVRFLNEARGMLVKMNVMDAGSRVTLKPTKAGSATYIGSMEIPSDVVLEAARLGRFYTQISPRTPATEFGVRGSAAWISVPIPQYAPIQMAVDANHPDRPAHAIFSSYPTRDGVRLTSTVWGDDPQPPDGPVAVFHFRNISVSPGNDGTVGLQIGVGVEKTGDFKDDPLHPNGYAQATLQVVNLTTGERSDPVTFSPETSRTEPVPINAKYLKGGNFDVLLRNTMPGQNLGILPGNDADTGAMALVTADRSFVINLIKSLFILWLLALLVVIIAIFCSTFVSWPIAVVLTLVILLAHWGVDQLGSALDRGTAGRTTVGQFKISDPSSAQVVAGTVDWLSTGLRGLSACLPDVEMFPVMEDIENGVSIPPAKVLGAMGVIFCYGLPLLVFSYVILRRKEVAP
jgi:ABC-type transport system involved in multi-copper enzyme maturation permease subunit